MDDSTQQKQFQPAAQPVSQNMAPDLSGNTPVAQVLEQPANSTLTSSDNDLKPSPSRSSFVKTSIGRQMPPQSAPRIPQPVSAPTNKEHEPILHSKVDVDKMTEPEIQEEEKAVERKIEEIVEETPDIEPKLPEEVQKAGVTLAKESTPMPTSPSGKVVLPMTYEEAIVTRKKYRWKDSISWLATVLIYHFKKLKRNPKDIDTSGFG